MNTIRIEDHLYVVDDEHMYKTLVEEYGEGSTPVWRYVLTHGRIVRKMTPDEPGYYIMEAA